VELLKQRHDLRAALGVQVSGGLVRQKDGGIIDERPGNGHPLLLTAGHLRRPVANPVSQTDQA